MLRWLLAAPFLLLLVLFTLSNREMTRLHLWPLDLSLEAPLSIALLVATGIGFLLGALLLWLSVLSARRQARRAEHATRLLEAQVQELKARLAPQGLPPPG